MGRDIYAGILQAPGADFNAVRDGRAGQLYSLDIDLNTKRAAGSTANPPLILEIPGNFFYADMSPDYQGAAVVHFQEPGYAGGSTTFYAGNDSYGMARGGIYCPPGFMAKMPFTRLMIENVPQAGRRFRIFYGTDVQIEPGASAQMTVTGSVSVIDGGKARTLAGQAFMGNVNNAGVAGQYSHVQLWNPANTGKNLVVEQVLIGSTNTQSVSMRSHNVALANAFATPNPQSKYLGGGASVGQLRYESAAAFIPATGDMQAINISANVVTPFKPSEPIVIPPGQGLVLFTNNFVAAPLTAGFELFDESV